MKLELYDTTLRDGAQMEGMSLSVEDKLKIARKLDELGVHYIEGGWPGSNPKDAEFFVRAQSLNLQNARLAAFGSTRKAGGDAATDANLRALLDARTPVVTLVGKTQRPARPRRARDVARREPGDDRRLRALHRRATAAPSSSTPSTSSTASTPTATYALQLPEGGRQRRRDLPRALRHQRRHDDASSSSTPSAPSRRRSMSPLGIHTHNDADLAVANTLAAVDEGVRAGAGAASTATASAAATPTS